MLPVDIYAEIFQYLISAALTDFKKFIKTYEDKSETKIDIIYTEIRALKNIYILSLASTCKNAAAALKLFDEGGRCDFFLSKFVLIINKKTFKLDIFKSQIPDNSITKVIFPSDFLSEKVESAAIISPFSFVKFHIYIYNLHFSENKNYNEQIEDYILYKINFADIDIVFNTTYYDYYQNYDKRFLKTSKINITSKFNKDSISTDNFNKESFLWPFINYLNKKLLLRKHYLPNNIIRRAAADYILKKLEKNDLKNIKYSVDIPGNGEMISSVKAADIIYGIYCNL